MTAKEYLSQYLEASEAVNAQLLKLTELWSLACKTTPTLKQDVVQSSGSNTAEDSIVKILSAQEEANRLTDAAVDARRKCIALICERYGMQRKILLMRYIHGAEWNPIAEQCEVSRRKAIMIHDEALAILDYFLMALDAA